MNKVNGDAQRVIRIILAAMIIIAVSVGLANVFADKADDEKKDMGPRTGLDLNAGSTEKSSDDYAFQTEEDTTKAEVRTREVVLEQTVKETQVSNAKAQPKYAFSEADVLTWPVEGEVLLDYSMDSTIWFPTLKEYKCNPGLVIKAAEGQNIVAAASGVVESVEKSKEYGTIITVDIGNGYKTIFGQVNNSNNLKKGSMVIEGQVIATVNKTTRNYSTEGDNLFFELTKEGKPVNPRDYLKQ